MEKIHPTQVKRHTFIAIIMAGMLAVGFWSGFVYRGTANLNDGVSAASVEVPVHDGSTAHWSEFWKTWNLIDEKSPYASESTTDDRVYGAIKGLVGSLNDPYSVFFDPKEANKFQEAVSGSFSGVGMEIGIKNGLLTVVAPIKGSPAEKAGIRSGDYILKINNVSTENMTTDEAVTKIRGEAGTTVTITIQSGHKLAKDIVLTREVINVPSIESKQLDDGIFKISIYSFSDSTDGQFADALTQFAKSSSSKLIIDLRGNPGGYLDSAVNTASYFIPEGEPVVIERHKEGGDEIYRSFGFSLLNGKKMKIAVLVDEGSASASEILAGALHDYGIATLIGVKTFGKGSVQELIPMDNKTSLKLTIAKWFTPKGTSIDKNGLLPDVAVPITDEDITAKNDRQLKKAIELLNK